jgi:hypothetical protein
MVQLSNVSGGTIAVKRRWAQGRTSMFVPISSFWRWMLTGN